MFILFIRLLVPLVGGPKEIVQHGINAYQLDQRDLSAIVNHIAKLKMSPALYIDLSKNATHRAEQFTYSQKINSIVKILQAKRIADSKQAQVVIH